MEDAPPNIVKIWKHYGFTSEGDLYSSSVRPKDSIGNEIQSKWSLTKLPEQIHGPVEHFDQNDNFSVCLLKNHFCFYWENSSNPEPKRIELLHETIVAFSLVSASSNHSQENYVTPM